MSTDRDTTRIVRSWLEEGATALPDRVLDAVLDQVPATSQRRPLWPARRFRRDEQHIEIRDRGGGRRGRRHRGSHLAPEERRSRRFGTWPDPRRRPRPRHDRPRSRRPRPATRSADSRRLRSWPARTPSLLSRRPMARACATRLLSRDASNRTRVTSFASQLTVPDGWSGAGHWLLPRNKGNNAPDGAGLSFERGAWLLIDPCVESDTNWIPVGPTVADFVDAVANHPILDTTNLSMSRSPGTPGNTSISRFRRTSPPTKVQPRVRLLPSMGAWDLRPGAELTAGTVGPRCRRCSCPDPEL